MSKTRFSAFVLSSALLALAPVIRAQDHEHSAGERLGNVKFETSCAAAARDPFNHAMALLHSFEFGPAIDGFNATLKVDPACAMAHWGIAMARWTNPFAAIMRSPAQIQQGLEAIGMARKANPK